MFLQRRLQVRTKSEAVSLSESHRKSYALFRSFLTFNRHSRLTGLRITTGLRMTPVVSGELPMQVTGLVRQSLSFRTLSNLIVQHITDIYLHSRPARAKL